MSRKNNKDEKALIQEILKENGIDVRDHPRRISRVAQLVVDSSGEFLVVKRKYVTTSQLQAQRFRKPFAAGIRRYRAITKAEQKKHNGRGDSNHKDTIGKKR